MPGEYCPGEFSVNAAGTTKIVGTAQRLTRHGYLFSAVVLVTDPEPVRAVLVDAYAALGLDWRPASVGCVADHVPDVTVADVEDALLPGLHELLPGPDRGRSPVDRRGDRVHPTVATSTRPDTRPSATRAGSGPSPSSRTRKKTLGGGLDELRARLAVPGVDELLWFEVKKSKKAPKRVREAVKAGADLVVVWGGDGMVQRSCDALAGTGVPLAIIPAGTANLLAHNLGIPQDLAAAVEIAFAGRRRALDLGKINGEHFAVMAGVGFDAELMRDADRG